MQVDGHSTDWLNRDFPWIYPKEVTSAPPGVRPGDHVRIRGIRGEDLGTGVWDSGWIAVRRFRPEGGPLDAPFFQERLEAALLRRRGLLPADTTAWRAVNAENDGMPGIRVDVWGPVVAITLDSPSLVPLVAPLAAALEDVLPAEAVVQGFRRDPRETAGADGVGPRTIRGTAPEVVEVAERGVRFRVRPAAGSDAGLFTDMRDNRAWLDPAWAGRRVLNLFCYTGAFSVFAALKGAEEVVSADLSGPALERVRENLALNGLDPAAWAFAEDDTFRLLDALRRAGRRFDAVVADPPSFSHSVAGTFSVTKDMPRLVAGCLRVLAPGGLLVLATNQGTYTPRAFQEDIVAGARRAGRDLHLVHAGGQPCDHPARVSFPEGRYLKFQVLVG